MKKNTIDPKNGFCSETKIFHSLRPPVSLPPDDIPLSAASYAFSLQLGSPWPPDSTALINSATGHRISYSEFYRRTQTLASYLQKVIGLSKGDTSFILSPNTIQIPILYFSLLSIGVVVSPANPISTETEISHQIELCKPVIAFAVSTTAHKLPKTLRYGTILIDSSEFDSVMTTSGKIPTTIRKLDRVEVSQSDAAAVMYSSGTTGKIKGVMVTHRNLISIVANIFQNRLENRESPAVMLYTVPYFHMFGFFYSLKSVALSESVVVMERLDLRRMLRAAEEFQVTHLAAAPPIVVAMVKGNVTDGYDLRRLECVICGAAPLGKEVISRFNEKFPRVVLSQGYGLTESTGAASRSIGPEESLHWGSVGKLISTCEAKIVDLETGVALPPCKQGELWLRGPTITKGYVGDPKATSEILVSDGWFKTGDVCYIDEEGFLYVVDRLKELIKYKGYQVPPAELEQLLQSHPEINDAAVIPYPDEEAGEVPMAFVVRRSQSKLNEAEVMDFIANQVAPYKKVRRVAFVRSIPKSAAGKILRKQLKETILPRLSLSKL